MLSLCGTGGRILAAQDAGPAATLTVMIYNYAAIPAGTLEAAEREAGNILREAGVELAWVECGLTEDDTEKFAACERVADRRGPVVKLIPQSMAVRMPRPADWFAIAVPSAITVFHHLVREAAEKGGIPEPRLLGCILAHELGHAVLGTDSHSPSGIMKAKLRPADFALAERGLLRFSDEEAKRLRAGLRE
jgi:hypothetical protein